MSIDKINIRKRIYGCLFGAFIGDFYGFNYEFQGSECTKEAIKKNKENNRFHDGMISDDTEMILCLMNSIIETKKYDSNNVLKHYINWYQSDPIDIGVTITKALSSRIKNTDNNENIKYSPDSLSNGVLMRIAPIGILTLKLDNQELITIINNECELTHSNAIIKDVSYVYCLAIKYALLGYSKEDIYNKSLENTKMDCVRKLLIAAKNKPEPIYLISGSGEELHIKSDNRIYMGYYGIALQNTFYELLNGTDYYNSIINIIQRGGDTDTNACIAGAVLGAYYEYKNIPQIMRHTIKNKKYQRQEYYPELSMIDINKRIQKLVDIVL